MPSPDVIEPIARALSIIGAMNQHRLTTISDLHRITELPKPTVHRILATLMNCGYVAKDIDRSVYMLTEKVLSLSSGYGKEAWLLQASTPVARKITRDVKWPVAIGIFDYNAMVVQYSTRPYSEFVLQGSTVNKRFQLFKSAMGQAFLGFCEDEQLKTVLGALRDDELQEDPILDDDYLIKRFIADVQARGYGLRKGNRGESTHMALPIKSESEVIGVIGLSIFSSCFNDTVAQEYLALLRESATTIASSMDKMMALSE
jgi:IclR family transcriptional regulator, mhp operon transcriptional activator